MRQRAAAAFFAISDRCAGVSFAALAAPPFCPPSLPSATAAAFFAGGGSSFGTSPEAWSTMNLASWFRSRGGLLERVGMGYTVARGAAGFKPGRFQTETLPSGAMASPLESRCPDLRAVGVLLSP